MKRLQGANRWALTVAIYVAAILHFDRPYKVKFGADTLTRIHSVQTVIPVTTLKMMLSKSYELRWQCINRTAYLNLSGVPSIVKSAWYESEGQTTWGAFKGLSNRQSGNFRTFLRLPKIPFGCIGYINVMLHGASCIFEQDWFFFSPR